MFVLVFCIVYDEYVFDVFKLYVEGYLLKLVM